MLFSNDISCEISTGPWQKSLKEQWFNFHNWAIKLPLPTLEWLKPLGN